MDNGESSRKQFSRADNMTDEVAALSVLIQNDLVSTEIDSFYERWADDRLVIDKWFMLQTSLSQPSKSLEITKTLTKHSDFNKKIQIDFEPPWWIYSKLGCFPQSRWGRL